MCGVGGQAEDNDAFLCSQFQECGVIVGCMPIKEEEERTDGGNMYQEVTREPFFEYIAARLLYARPCRPWIGREALNLIGQLCAYRFLTNQKGGYRVPTLYSTSV